MGLTADCTKVGCCTAVGFEEALSLFSLGDEAPATAKFMPGMVLFFTKKVNWITIEILCIRQRCSHNIG